MFQSSAVAAAAAFSHSPLAPEVGSCHRERRQTLSCLTETTEELNKTRLPPAFSQLIAVIRVNLFANEQRDKNTGAARRANM